MVVRINLSLKRVCSSVGIKAFEEGELVLVVVRINLSLKRVCSSVGITGCE